MFVAADHLPETGFIRVRMLEKAKAELDGQNPPHRIVYIHLADRSLPHKRGQGICPEILGVVAATLHIQSRIFRHGDRGFVAAGQVMHLFQPPDAAPVGPDISWQAHPLLQHRGQIVAGTHHDIAVDGVIRCHGVAGAAGRPPQTPEGDSSPPPAARPAQARS